MSGPSELDDTELTTEELAEVLASGNTIKVYFGDLFVFHISVSVVAVFTRHDLTPDEVVTLAEGLAEGAVLLNPTPRVETPISVDAGQSALLDRALAARRMLVGA